MVGANDVTHRVPQAAAVRDLARAVETLRAAGAAVVVGTCPDLGTVAPLWQPLRGFARVHSRRMARAQTVAVVEAGGISVSLGDLLGPEFGASPQLWSADRFHPSAAGYRRVVEVLLPAALEGLGVEVTAGTPTATACRTSGSPPASPRRTRAWSSRRSRACRARPRPARAGWPGWCAASRGSAAPSRRGRPPATRTRTRAPPSGSPRGDGNGSRSERRSVAR